MNAELDSLYYINVGPKGTFQASGQRQTTPESIDALFNYLEQNSVDKLILYFHGGLVSESEGLKTANRLTPKFREAGSHPISFVWETGLRETIASNITTLHRTQLVQKLLVYILKQVTKRWGIDLFGRGPGQGMTLEEIQAELAKDVPFRDFDHPEESNGRAKGGAPPPNDAAVEKQRDEIELELEEDLVADPELDTLIKNEAPNIELLNPELKELKEDERGARGALEIAFAVVKVLTPVVIRTLKRRANQLDHGLYPTVMEELFRELSLADLGAWLWSGMKSAAREMWQPNGGHVGAYFLEKLAALKERNPDLVIDLIGHSAGSIAICYLLDAAERYPALKMRNIVLLAPACTMDLFYEQIVSKPERYEKFRMFTMSDDYESKDVLVRGIYTRSLVYFVSGALEDETPKPLAGLERWMRPDVLDPRGILAKVREFLYLDPVERLVLAKTKMEALDGFRCDAISHGDFDNEERTLDSIKFLLTN